MVRKLVTLLFVLAAIGRTTSFVQAGVVITLEAFDQNGQPIAGPVASGTSATVDILLSRDAGSGNVADVRFIQFDFDLTGAGIVLDSFTWSVDPNGYSFQDPDLPLTNVTSILFGSSPDLLTLTAEPVKVASVDITIQAAGTLDAINATNTDDNFGADVRAGFDMQERFNSMLGNLTGGTLAFTVTGGGGGDNTNGNGNDNGNSNVNGNSNDNTNGNDNTNANDNVNANTNDNANGNDNGSGGGGGDNQNTNDNTGGGSGGGSGPRLCGAGMLGPGLLILLGLCLKPGKSRRQS